jgi:hypothetical protein
MQDGASAPAKPYSVMETKALKVQKMKQMESLEGPNQPPRTQEKTPGNSPIVVD